MTKYYAEYSCGHTRKVSLTGPQWRLDEESAKATGAGALGLKV